MIDQTSTTEHRIRIDRDTADALKAEARRRGVPVDELASQIIATVVVDDLFAAVLGKVNRLLGD
jgi:hypothetical protein